MSAPNGKFWAGPKNTNPNPNPETPKPRKPKARKPSRNEREEAKDTPTGGASFFFKSEEQLNKENESDKAKTSEDRARERANIKATEYRRRSRKARQAEAERLKREAYEREKAEASIKKRLARNRTAGVRDLHLQEWTKACNLFFADKEGKAPFPQPPKRGCSKTKCVKGELLGVCHHEIDWLLNLDEAGLKKELLRWHPDKFSGRGQVQVKAQEVFVLVQRLVDGA